MRISNAEWVVLEAVWAGEAVTAAEVIDRVGQSHDWNHRTIRTLLARLVEKQAVTFEVDGSRYLYRAAVSRKQCVRKESRSFLDKVFGGDVRAMLVHFVNDDSLDNDDLEELRQLLDARSPRGRRKP